MEILVQRGLTMTRSTNRLLGLLTTVLAVLITAPAATAQMTSYMTIQAKHSGQCLNVLDSGLNNGADVVQGDACQPGSTNLFADNFLWQLEEIAPGDFLIRAKHSGQCLNVLNSGLNNGADVVQGDACQPGSTNLFADNFLWQLEEIAPGDFLIRAKHSGQCLNVLNSGLNNGADVVQGDACQPGSTNLFADNFVWRIRLQGIADPQPPVLAAEAIVGAADFRGGSIAPGSILSVFAEGSAGLVAAQLDDEGKFPAALGGVRVLFDEDPGRMIFSTPGQSNLIAPFSIAGKSTVNVELEIDGLRSPPAQLDVAPTRPQIFSASQQGTGQAALLNQNFSTNGATNPAARGSVIQIFLTGGGQTDPPAVDGALAPTAEPLPRFANVQVLVGGVECQVVYAGAAPGLVHGVGQINVVVDDAVTPGGAVSLEVRIGGVSSQPEITVAIS